MEVKSKSAAVRERLSHPVVDGDGHIMEILPLLEDYILDTGGAKVLETYRARLRHSYFDGSVARVGGPQGWYGLSPDERRDKRVSRIAFWSWPTRSALDRATVMLPKLFRERLEELGIDFAILYASIGLRFMRDADDEQRRVTCRAFNRMCADLYGPHADRMTVAALIPMNTPEEALDELEYAVKTLKMKAVVLGTCIRRPIAEVARKAPELAPFATWMDVIGHGSDYDYDPVWKKCVELKVAATTHTHLVGWGARTSPDNWVYNHIGHFGASGEAFCKALVIGGVVQRFPTLQFAFLEGGVGWACSLFNDLIEHWEKRNVKYMRENLDPALLDRTALAELFVKYGGEVTQKALGTLVNPPAKEKDAEIDDWSALEIETPRQFAGFFKNFYFGCEADDRIAALAFNSKVNHYGTKLQAFFSSDVGHFDVKDITAVVAEAYELVEDELITPDDFRSYTFSNVVKLHASMNPDFFKGTAVEDAAKAVMTA